MPDLVFRGNLNAATWPFLSTQQGRSVIIGQLDTNASKFAQFGGRDADRDVGIPQALFMQNVFPTAHGFQSVGFAEKIPGIYSGLGRAFDKAFIIKDIEDRKTILSPGAGYMYIYDAMTAAWDTKLTFPLGDLGFNKNITTAYVQDRQFVCFANKGTFEYDFVAGTFTQVTLTALTDSLIVGIGASNGYLIAFGTGNLLYWSSLTDPTDFSPSILTGAGSGSIVDLRGSLTAVLPVSGGFIVYSTENAVFASYTGNIYIPWNFKEISGSGGVVYSEHVTYESNLSFHYAWTSKGLLKVEKNVAAPIHPEVTDFITGKIMEDFNYSTDVLAQIKTSTQLVVKLTHVGGRYLIISYGQASFTHALVYDEILARWGKLKIDHADCFSWPTPNVYGEVTYQDLLDLLETYEDLLYTSYSDLFNVQYTVTRAKEDIAFLTTYGQVVTVNFDLGDDTDEGVLFLGKFQVVRNNDFTLHAVDIESVDDSSTSFELAILTSYDGKTLASLTTAPVEVLSVANLRRFETRVTGINHTLRVTGSFALDSIVLEGINSGQRG